MSQTYTDLNYFSRDSELNNFSYWFPKIEHCGIRVPKSVVIPVPEDMWKGETFFMENIPEDEARIERFVRENVLPALDRNGFSSPMLFIKNGAFSNKFDAGKCCFCLKDAYDLVRSISLIQYYSLCNETGGESEIVVRERISSITEIVPEIYSGLPLRPEFRVFYDFDRKEPIFTVDYWEYDYVYPHIFEATDKIVFERMKKHLAKSFRLKKDWVTDIVSDAMKNVTGLEGPWSIDCMLDCYPVEVQQDIIEDLHPDYFGGGMETELYLIDMAVAERSAYWDKRP